MAKPNPVPQSFSTWRMVSRQLAFVAGITSWIILATAFTDALSQAVAEETSSKQVVWRTDHLESTFFAEGATAGDLDGDGNADVVSGPY
jgi:hypothetical protein